MMPFKGYALLYHWAIYRGSAVSLSYSNTIPQVTWLKCEFAYYLFFHETCKTQAFSLIQNFRF